MGRARKRAIYKRVEEAIGVCRHRVARLQTSNRTAIPLQLRWQGKATNAPPSHNAYTRAYFSRVILGPWGSLVYPWWFGTTRLRFKSGRTHNLGEADWNSKSRKATSAPVPSCRGLAASALSSLALSCLPGFGRSPQAKEDADGEDHEASDGEDVEGSGIRSREVALQREANANRLECVPYPQDEQNDSEGDEANGCGPPNHARSESARPGIALPAAWGKHSAK